MLGLTCIETRDDCGSRNKHFAERRRDVVVVMIILVEIGVKMDVMLMF
jgi:hypothetical protein